MTSYEVIIRPKRPEIKSQDEIRFTIEAPSLPDGNESDLVDALENAAMEIGVQIERGLFTNHLKRIEMKLCNSLTHLDDNCEVVRNGYRKLKISARFGIIDIERQVAFCKTCGKDFIPINSVLPEHNGMVITKGLQELACFLSMFSSYRIAQRLLGGSAMIPMFYVRAR
ncbi:MAG: hypothetical protein HPY71_13250 [Firmicutes bacterium]|nr:hypothetical protein [Bacillota bacterium]